MSAASYYDQSQERSQLSSHEPGPMQSGNQTQGLGQEMQHEQQRGYAQQGHNDQGGVYAGQQQANMGNSNYAQGAQQHMNGNGEQAAVADDRDTLTKWLDRIEKKFGGDRFNNPDNAEKNKAMNENILKRLKQVGMMVMQKGPGMLASKF
ncbi:hypothetical protein MMC28_007296 [Mycoblastus sanguinarius]|nr:hypothetical protein [Mycoblastus sanguinarius]